MPNPKKNEGKQDFLKRCTEKLISSENRSPEQAYKLCNLYWDDAQGQRAALTLAAPLELQAGDGDDDEPKSFMITAYTGTIIRAWFGDILFDVKGMKTKAKFPILREHERDRIVGFSTKTWKDDNHLFIKGDFAKNTQDAHEVRSLAQEGFPWQASVSIWPEKIKVLESDKETANVNGQEVSGPLEIWTKSRVGETSFVALGADDETAAIVLADNGVRVPVDISYQPKIQATEVCMMELKELKKDHSELYEEVYNLGVASVDVETIKKDAHKEGVEQERTRVTEILVADADFDATKEAITGGIGSEESYKLFYQTEKAKGEKALKDLEASAPITVGTEVIDEEAGASLDPDVELAQKAKKLAQEKGISITAALRQVSEQHPELTEKALPRSPMQ